ncbi:hypothetical protein [Streptomyces virginiae]|uniref:hypothetical protein n=1 Tax=Streptomyces virginiae TaxID=1961 RepID=UPI003437470E
MRGADERLGEVVRSGAAVGVQQGLRGGGPVAVAQPAADAEPGAEQRLRSRTAQPYVRPRFPRLAALPLVRTDGLGMRPLPVAQDVDSAAEPS